MAKDMERSLSEAVQCTVLLKGVIMNIYVDGVAHEDAGLQPHPLEGDCGDLLRLQATPQGVRAPQLPYSLKGNYLNKMKHSECSVVSRVDYVFFVEKTY